MTKENVVLVDQYNRRIGVEEKLKAHREGRLHRAFSIFVFNSKRELLLQQRAKSKYHSGGLWSNTVCSHPRPNERYLQAAHRRLEEEFGFDCNLKKSHCFIYNTGRLESGLVEHEYDCVFIGSYDGPIRANAKEVAGYEFVPLGKLRADMKKNPHKYSFWLGLALRGLV